MIKKSIIRSTVFAVLCSSLLISTPAAAEGDYDGIWSAPVMPGVFVMVWQSSDRLLALLLELDPTSFPQLVGGEWEAYAGRITGNAANMFSIISRAQANATVEFSSPDTGEVTILSCTPPEECPIPLNQPFPIERFF